MENISTVLPDLVRDLYPFVIAFGVAMLVTPLVRFMALRWKIVDEPGTSRKIHKQPIALLGGLAIFVSLFLVVGGYALWTDKLFGGYLLEKHVIGLAIGGVLLMLAGVLDDRYNVKARYQLVLPALAALTVIGSGIGVEYIQNPFGEAIRLDSIRFTLFEAGSVPYRITLFADLFTFLWLMGMMYTTKFLDGLDGLVPGVGAIGAIILFFLSFSSEVMQPETALLAIIFAGACLGFVVWNWNPAQIFLGEGGSVYIGFMLGALAIISGAKVATALLIMGVPILDVVWVIVRRFWTRAPLGKGDRKHLHFRLLDVGLSHRGAVLVLYVITAAFGMTSLFLGTNEKVVALSVLVAVMLILAAVLVVMYKRRGRKNF